MSFKMDHVFDVDSLSTTNSVVLFIEAEREHFEKFCILSKSFNECMSAEYSKKKIMFYSVFHFGSNDKNGIFFTTFSSIIVKHALLFREDWSYPFFDHIVKEVLLSFR